MNELPLRKLFKALNGSEFLAPHPIHGNIRKRLKNTEHLDIVNFNIIGCFFPVIDNLNSDAKYVYDMCNSISQGQVATSLKIRSPGKIHNARWITLANNVLRLYVGLENLTKEIVILTKYIMNVYAPVYFLIKYNSSVSDGARNCFHIIKKS